jgi:four helix bundle protein
VKCEKLDVWKRAAALSAEIYLYSKNLNDYGFRDQITRAGLSVPSNIAEGLERQSDRESWRFLDIAHGSAAELKTQIYIGMKIEYIDREQGKQWIEELENISRMIGGLKRSLLKKSDDGRRTTDDGAPEVHNA